MKNFTSIFTRPAAAYGALGTAAAFFGAAAVVAAGSAGGVAPDTTPPNLQVSATWVDGQQIGPSNLLNDPPNNPCEGIADDITTVKYEVSWSASDPSGLDDYNEWIVESGETPAFYGWWGDLGGDTSFIGTGQDYIGACGGDNGYTDGWAITAYDKAGNAKYLEVDGVPIVYQEDGTTYQDGPLPVTYTGSWTRSLCSCASGGAQKYTSSANANLAFSSSAQRVGIVAATGPARGKFRVYVDGITVAVVDTHSTANKNRVLVWAQDLSAGASHTIQVRNMATAGHPRIDIDAILFS